MFKFHTEVEMTNYLNGNVVETKKGGETVFYYTLLSEDIVAEFGLPASLIVGVIDNPEDSNEPLGDIVRRSLKVNVGFKETLHKFCADVLSQMPQIESQASTQGSGWVYITDQRTPDPSGEVPPQDIIGAFEVNNGKIVHYQANPNYEVNSANGFTNFGPSVNREFELYMIDIAKNNSH